MAHNDEDLDGCDVEIEPLAPEEEELFVLFAEALDPSSPVTVEEVERQWAH